MRSHTESEWSKCLTEGVLSAIGNSPMVQLKRIYRDAHFRLFAKLEAANPGGSSKDRAALSIISKAIEKGQIRPGTTMRPETSRSVTRYRPMKASTSERPMVLAPRTAASVQIRRSSPA